MIVINNTNIDFNIQIKECDGKPVIYIEEPEQKTRLSDLHPGNIFKGKNGNEYIVCEQFLSGTAVVRKDVIDKTMAFGKDNNWANSKWRKYLNSEYYQEISDEFGKENINEHEADLTSLDGYDDYGTVRDKVSAMTIDRYRRYHKYIGNVSEWNYLSTPDSTPSGWSASGVQCVRDGGGVGYAVCWGGGALRPFFILNSYVQVQKVDKK